MRATANKILVKAYLNQKSAIQIKGPNDTTIELLVGKEYELNNRKKNPTICEVIDNNSQYAYIKTGDKLLVHHNFLSDPDANPRCIEHDPQSGMALFSIPAGRHIFCKLDNDGNLSPTCDNILVERLRNPIESKFIIIPDTVKQEHNDRVKVTAVSPEIDFVKPGQTVLIKDKADYEICYSWNKEDRNAIKVWAGKFEDEEYGEEAGDILGIVQ